MECGLYWAVPVFLMITGVNLLNYREKYDTSTYFRKRVMRTVIPWLAWSFLVLGWKVATGQLILEEKTEYSCAGVPLFRRNGYRQSGGRKPLFRNRDTALT